MSTRWVDIDRGRNGATEVRSRRVARDRKTKDSSEFEAFAAMPPLEAKRALLRMAHATGSIGGAHLTGKLAQDELAFARLQPEAEGGVGRLRRWLYGMRAAASAWEDDDAANLASTGFRCGLAAPAVFWHPVSALRLIVWGNDFTPPGRDKDLRDAIESMSAWCEIKARSFLGPGSHDIRVLQDPEPDSWLA